MIVEVLAVVMRRALVARQDPLVQIQRNHLRVATPACVAHHATSSSTWSSNNSSLSGTRSICSCACSHGVRTRYTSYALSNSVGSTPANSPMLTRMRRTLLAWCSRRTCSICSNIACTMLYSCIVRIPFLEKRSDTFGDLVSVRGARELLQFAIEMVVEAVHPGRLIQQLFGNGERVRRSRGDALGGGLHGRVERLDAVHRRDEAVREGALGGQPRIQQHQLHGAAETDQARQKERRALGAGQRRLPIRPFKRRPRRRDDEIARHRDAEPAGRSDAVDGCDKRFRRATDF